MNFKTMTIEQALEYCYDHAVAFKANCFDRGENGEYQFDYLISLIEDKKISPSKLPDYGMNFKKKCQ